MRSSESPAVPRALSVAERESLVRELLAQTSAQFPLQNLVTVEWRKYRTTAGTAKYQTNTICLSVYLLSNEEALRSTLLHEYAHLLAFERHGRRGAGHGAPWQIAMRELGQVPTVRHNYSCKRNVVRQEVVLRCAKCGCEIIRSRMLPKRKKFFHVACGGRVEFVRRQPKNELN